MGKESKLFKTNEDWSTEQLSMEKSYGLQYDIVFWLVHIQEYLSCITYISPYFNDNAFSWN
jgi:hypothetical protein